MSLGIVVRIVVAGVDMLINCIVPLLLPVSFKPSLHCINPW